MGNKQRRDYNGLRGLRLVRLVEAIYIVWLYRLYEFGGISFNIQLLLPIQVPTNLK
jgi:hypothetical protein